MPLLLIVLAFVGTLSAHKLSEREGRLLKLMSGVMMFQLGLVLTFVPAWLNDLWVTAGLLVVALVSTGIAWQLTRAGGDTLMTAQHPPVIKTGFPVAR